MTNPFIFGAITRGYFTPSLGFPFPLGQDFLEWESPPPSPP
ncbi:hypothetical protein [Synechocystis sp. FACHB-383]|nr:hypothetical protein [Synechocystis sp. FACHB-383]